MTWSRGPTSTRHHGTKRNHLEDLMHGVYATWQSYVPTVEHQITLYFSHAAYSCVVLPLTVSGLFCGVTFGDRCCGAGSQCLLQDRNLRIYSSSSSATFRPRCRAMTCSLPGSGENRVIGARSQNCETRLVGSKCPSFRSHGTYRLPLDGFHYT